MNGLDDLVAQPQDRDYFGRLFPEHRHLGLECWRHDEIIISYDRRGGYRLCEEGAENLRRVCSTVLRPSSPVNSPENLTVIFERGP